MITTEEIKSFLEGNDPEEHIVALEFDYATEEIYKIKEIPGKGKQIVRDTFIPFCWVGDLRRLNFYGGSKALQKEAMSKHKILIEKLETHDNERLSQGLPYLVKSLKGYRNLIQFFRDGGIDPWGDAAKEQFLLLPPVEQYLIQKEKRLFKGYEEYNDITRFVFDLEKNKKNKDLLSFSGQYTKSIQVSLVVTIVLILTGNGSLKDQKLLVWI